MIEAKNPNFKISAEKAMSAFQASLGSNFQYQVSRQKEQLRDARRADSINEYCSELDEKQKQKLIAFCEKWRGRLPIHIYRMLGNGRSEAEKTLAFNFIENIDELWVENLKTDEELINKASDDEILDLRQTRLQRTFGSESTDLGMFWTFAPYIYKNLPDKSSRDRLRKIFNWALLGDTPQQEISQQNLESYSILHLKGLREIYNDLGNIYYLTINPNDLTHKFTDQEAQRLVKEGVFD